MDWKTDFLRHARDNVERRRAVAAIKVIDRVGVNAKYGYVIETTKASVTFMYHSPSGDRCSMGFIRSGPTEQP
jgi:hypothetical protein